ncbi:hypothetical protein [Winogradskyella pacifica]|uniref:hypothetical protein n=1 Tax=Winogradskyella pacifica TaxID=664642 RepID=UPI0015C926AE|nr:hypothetical protein [Winogradskyella pacifica]
MTESDIQILQKEIDAVIEKYNREDFINQDFEVYSKSFKETYFQNQNLHTNKRVCEVIGCKNITIKKSHTIPKSSILKNIVFEGHLLTPKFDSSDNHPKNIMSKIGINNASVFPGFCTKHEDIFKSFEIDGKIDNVNKALLQTFRTLCRERVYRENELEINKIIREKYKKKINSEAQESITKALSKYPQFENVKDIELKGIDSIIDSLSKLDSFLISPLEQIKIFETSIYSALLKLPTKDKLIIRVANFDTHLPVSICGIGNQVYLKDKVETDSYLLLNVMPRKDSTSVICVGLERDKLLIQNYIDSSFSNPLFLLNMIESFMVNGSDHWFVNPKFWETLSEVKQKKILYDILFTEDSHLDEYPISIFDDVRMYIISTLKKNINTRTEKITEFEKEIIDKEIKKIKSADYEIITDTNILAEKLWNRLQKH